MTYTGAILAIVMATGGFLAAGRQGRSSTGHFSRRLADSSIARTAVKSLSLVLLAATLVVVTLHEGAEIGIPIWLCLVAIAVPGVVFSVALARRNR